MRERESEREREREEHRLTFQLVPGLTILQQGEVTRDVLQINLFYGPEEKRRRRLATATIPPFTCFHC